MIKVTVKKPSSRRYFLAQWVDPVTLLVKTRSTQTTIRRDAERFAAKLEIELNAGDFVSDAPITWAVFRKRYEDEVSATKRKKTRSKTKSTFIAIEREINPKMLQPLADPNIISKFSAAMRNGRSPSTIDGHLREVRKLLRWAHKMNLIKKVPHIEFPDFDEEMKGRPITAEEFDRYIAKVPECRRIDPRNLEGWLFFVRGLWMSSLRLEESMVFHWTNDKYLSVDFNHRRPMFRIQAAGEKGRTYRLLPMTPDFAEFLKQVPKNQRKGFVFNPLTRPPGKSKDGQFHRPTANHAGRVLCDIGELAGIRVNETKFASAHDFRRSFGFRWCKVVMPKTLQEMMRHASIQTTMKYYVGAMAEDAADEIYRAVALRSGNTSGNSSQNDDSEQLSEEHKTTTKHEQS